ncbi:Rha family transcriptional regulator [Weissella viridescens]|uniref:Rha family transcriptional regulator n=1 Tax=Weissella viridescens TaxID=1629 RepID=UPI001D0810B5|nr:Rha family transcriptional regulator [Weissella viridescens]MCB6839908.1 Rha family transcriptional regulator [Weissella viridescens]MCB6846640.1 Rha family transcriptional regulator [Weissella viridescens]
MNDLITVENGEPMTTSLKIAEVFGKRHTDVLETIRNKIKKIDELEESGNFRSPKFIESSFVNSQNKEHAMYKLNKDALVLVVMNYQTKEALKFQLDYIDAFNNMQKKLEQVGLSDRQTNLITAKAHKMQVENERLKELRLAMNQADKLERNDLSERLLEKEVETLVGHQVKHAVSIDHNSPFHLTASNIAERFGIPATRVGSVAKLLGMDEGVDRIKVDERWLYTERAVSKMRARLEA